MRAEYEGQPETHTNSFTIITIFAKDFAEEKQDFYFRNLGWSINQEENSLIVVAGSCVSS